MTLGNMRELGVYHLIGYCLNDAFLCEQRSDEGDDDNNHYQHSKGKPGIDPIPVPKAVTSREIVS
jgi:hypothetical protein